MAQAKGIQTRVFGPKTPDADAAGFLLPREQAVQLVGLFKEKLQQRKTGPVQMLVDAPDMPASVVNVFRYYGAAAVAHVLRAPPAGETPALAGIYVLLPGMDKDADEAAIAAVEGSRDKSGNPLPLSPKVYQALRDDVRPVFAMIFFTEEAVKDTSLQMLGICLGEAFFATVRNEKAPEG
jgi:hypothetical protein